MLLSYQLVDTGAVSLNAAESGAKGPEHEEEFDAGTGSDEELASLLSQMEVKSQPDKEHSLSELLTVLAEEDMAPPAEPSPSSLEAEAGDQADEP